MLVKKPFYNVVLSNFIRPYKLASYNLICLEFYNNYITKNINNIFENLDKKDFEDLRNDNSFLLIDNSGEGHSFKEFEIYTCIHSSLNESNIDPQKIFYISGNIFEKENYNQWLLLNNNPNPINIISINFWDCHVKTTCKYRVSFDETIKNIKEKQYFLCLNRRIRNSRLYLIYKIFESFIFKKTNISFDYLKKEYFDNFKDILNEPILERLIKSSPSILDIENFTVNQSGSHNKNLHSNSLISLVSETLSDSHNGTSLFFSEKTFRPMCFNHPIMIFGQPGNNKKLSILGYKTYDCYFNLNFDSTENFIDRYAEQIMVLENLSNLLDRMSESQKIDWLAQGKKVLEYNQQMIDEQTFNKSQSLKFLNLISRI